MCHRCGPTVIAVTLKHPIPPSPIFSLCCRQLRRSRRRTGCRPCCDGPTAATGSTSPDRSTTGPSGFLWSRSAVLFALAAAGGISGWGGWVRRARRCDVRDNGSGEGGRCVCWYRGIRSRAITPPPVTPALIVEWPRLYHDFESAAGPASFQGAPDCKTLGR